MTINSRDNIIKYIDDKKQATIVDIADHLNISRQAVHRNISRLINNGLVQKIGKAPKVFYILANKEQKKQSDQYNFSAEVKNLVENNFLDITPSGKKLEGMDGFIEWCRVKDLSVEKTIVQYVQIFDKYASYKKDGLIDGMYKLRHTFDEVYLDSMYYLDFYSIEIFGKTKLGQLLLYAKQSQDKDLIKELIEEVKPKVEILIKKHGITAIGYIPPTVKREVQLMKELENRMVFNLPVIDLVKVRGDISVPQKTLSKLNDRIENATTTIVVKDRGEYDKVLLIDDALGSGATLNEVAKKLKLQKIAKTAIGLAITGSFSGFEIISEV